MPGMDLIKSTFSGSGLNNLSISNLQGRQGITNFAWSLWQVCVFLADDKRGNMMCTPITGHPYSITINENKNGNQTSVTMTSKPLLALFILPLISLIVNFLTLGAVLWNSRKVNKANQNLNLNARGGVRANTLYNDKVSPLRVIYWSTLVAWSLTWVTFLSIASVIPFFQIQLHSLNTKDQEVVQVSNKLAEGLIVSIVATVLIFFTSCYGCSASSALLYHLQQAQLLTGAARPQRRQIPQFPRFLDPFFLGFVCCLLGFPIALFKGVFDLFRWVLAWVLYGSEQYEEFFYNRVLNLWRDG